MIGGVDLRRGSDLGAVADRDFDDVEDHAIEVEEHAVAEADIVAVVAKERRPDHRILADISKALRQDRMTLRYRQRQRRVVACDPDFGRQLFGGEFGIGTI